jgi:hypothetical protein
MKSKGNLQGQRVAAAITVLYARAKGGIIARTVSHLIWQMFRVLAQMFPRRKARILSFCGPAVLIVLVAA